MSSAKLKQQQQQQFNANLLRWGHNLKNNPVEECSSCLFVVYKVTIIPNKNTIT